jgi:hypothetical protein
MEYLHEQNGGDTHTGIEITVTWMAIDQWLSYVALCLAVVMLAMDGQLLVTVLKEIVSVRVTALLWKCH